MILYSYGVRLAPYGATGEIANYPIRTLCSWDHSRIAAMILYFYGIRLAPYGATGEIANYPIRTLCSWDNSIANAATKKGGKYELFELFKNKISAGL